MADELRKLRRQGLLARLSKVGSTPRDRLARRYTECRTSGCRRQADASRPYGPFLPPHPQNRLQDCIHTRLTVGHSNPLEVPAAPGSPASADCVG